MPETPVEHPVRTFATAIAAVTVLAIMNLFVKMASDHYTTAQIIFFRNALGFLPLIALMARGGGWVLLKTERPWFHLLRGVVGITAMVFFFRSFAMLPLAEATSIHFAAPLLVTILSIPILGERVGLPRWGAVTVGLVAVVYMLEPWTMVGGDDTDGKLAGRLVALGSAFFAGIVINIMRHLGRTDHALTISFYATVCGTVIGAIGMVFMWEPLQGGPFYLLALVGLFGSVGQVLWTYSYAHAPAAYVAPFFYLSIFFAVLFDIVLFADWPEPRIWIGSAVIIGSGLMLVWRESRKKEPEHIPAEELYEIPPAAPTERDEEDPL